MFFFLNLALTDNEVLWASDHLGHTKAVYLQHCRQRSGYIERIKIAKLLLLHHLNLSGEVMRNKIGGLGYKWYKPFISRILYSTFAAFQEYVGYLDMGRPGVSFGTKQRKYFIKYPDIY